MVRGEQKNLLEAFIRNQSEFAVDVPPEERSGRVLIGDDMRLRLQQRKKAGVGQRLREREGEGKWERDGMGKGWIGQCHSHLWMFQSRKHQNKCTGVLSLEPYFWCAIV
jgi:hypothetical protein